MASVAFPSLAKSVTLKDGTTYGYIKVMAEPGKPTLLFLHGYPSSSYEWRHQVAQVQQTGYGMIAPDLLGYGDTDKPKSLEAYEIFRMAKQVVEIVDHEGLEKVVGIGHDWGAGLLSALAQRHQNRFWLFIFISVAYIPKLADFANVDVVNDMAMKFLGRPIFGYWKFHNDPKAAGMIDNLADPTSFTSLVYPSDPDLWIDNVCKEGGMRSWVENEKKAPRADYLTEKEEQMHIKILAMGGYEGPLNWYKQALAGISAASEEDLTEEDRKIKIPLLFIGTEKDRICVPEMMSEGMKPYVDNLTIVNVDTGHWAMLEKREEVFNIINNFVIANVY